MATVAIQEGRPSDVIVQEARARYANLIIIGTHEEAGLLRVLRRNTVARVIRRAPGPVRVVPIANGSAGPLGRFKAESCAQTNTLNAGEQRATES